MANLNDNIFDALISQLESQQASTGSGTYVTILIIGILAVVVAYFLRSGLNILSRGPPRYIPYSSKGRIIEMVKYNLRHRRPKKYKYF